MGGRGEPVAGRLPVAPLAALLTLLLAACGGGGEAASGNRASGPVTLRLGYFPNVTHASAIVGVEEGLLAEALAPDVRLTTSTFNAGPAAVEALFSGALDATYIGPNPAFNAYAKSGGRAVRIVAGAASGGASLVVKPAVSAAADLKGRKVASPQLGGTQDVALRTWLASHRLKTDVQGGGDVSVVPQENAQTLETFRSGQIDGAWVPEPWATRLVREGGGKVLVDERDLWPGGRFVTTLLIVRTEFLERHRDVVARLLEGHVRANEFVNANPEEAQRVTNDGIGKVTGRKLDPAVMADAWTKMTFTDDPAASSFATSAENAQRLGLAQRVDLKGIWALEPLNDVLRRAGKPAVSAQ